MTDFSQLKITTITLDVLFDGNVLDVLEDVNNILPITRLPNHNENKIYSKLINIPHNPEYAGAIIGTKHKDISRGIKRSKRRNFKNCVSMDVQTTIKNVNIKLSKQKIHLVGASSHRDGIKAAYYIIKHVNYAQHILDCIHSGEISNLNIAITLLFFKNKIKGPITKIYKLINKQKLKNGKFFNVFDNEYQIKHLINHNFEFDIIPFGVNEDFLRFLILHVSIFDYYEDYCDHIDSIIKVKRIISKPLKIVDSYIIMMNYNFKLGFLVDRLQLKHHIRRLGFFAHFDPTSSYSVSIHIPYYKEEIYNNEYYNSDDYNYSGNDEDQSNDIESEDEENSDIEFDNEYINDQEEDEQNYKLEIKSKKKKKAKKITFLVYKEGSVTLSGPGGKIMEDAYNLFINAIFKIRHRIEFFNKKG